jgi:hypothetical protein
LASFGAFGLAGDEPTRSSGFVNELESFWQHVSGNQAPPGLVAVALIAAAVVAALLLLPRVLGAIVKTKQLLRDELLPGLKPEERRRARLRARFAQHSYDEIRRLNSEQAWSDFRYAELEAEIEAEGAERSWSLWRRLAPRRSELRRERSLTRALEHSGERLLIVEGDPGAGKSVALRRVALDVSRRAARKPTLSRVIPLYLNLKELVRGPDEPVDRALVESFALKALNRANDRDIAQFLDEEFRRGVEQGRWLFLLDSFDEIPEILGSTEPGMSRQFSQHILPS